MQGCKRVSTSLQKKAALQYSCRFLPGHWSWTHFFWGCHLTRGLCSHKQHMEESQQCFCLLTYLNRKKLHSFDIPSWYTIRDANSVNFSLSSVEILQKWKDRWDQMFYNLLCLPTTKWAVKTFQNNIQGSSEKSLLQCYQEVVKHFANISYKFKHLYIAPTTAF